MKSSQRYILLAGLLGNTLELYDYTLYGYFAAILASLFFPASDPLIALITSYGVFATGFIMRPVGAILFGYIGDKWGRKRALELSILLIAAPTCLIALLPTYAQAGIIGPLLLILLRMAQGLSVGGEIVGSYTFVAEHAPEGRRGFYASSSMVGCFTGKMLAAGMGAALAWLLSKEEMARWGWRLAFALGLLFALTGFYVRKKVKETPAFAAMQADKHSQVPLREAIQAYKREIFLAIGCMIPHTVALHILYVYFPVFLSQHFHISFSQALQTNIASLAVVSICLLIGGFLADRCGRKPVLLYGTLALIAMTWWMFLQLPGSSLWGLAGMQMAVGVAFGISHAPLSVLLVELFPAHVRYTCSAISYNVTVGIFGGLTPLITTSWLAATGDTLAPAYWLTASAILAVPAYLALPETMPTSTPQLAHD